MASKMISADSQELSNMVVDSVLAVAERSGEQYKVDIDNIKVEKKVEVQSKIQNSSME
jgi:chaperonin GroEL (HSP60 family)